jgi:hypothetical protein
MSHPVSRTTAAKLANQAYVFIGLLRRVEYEEYAKEVEKVQFSNLLGIESRIIPNFYGVLRMADWPRRI